MRCKPDAHAVSALRCLWLLATLCLMAASTVIAHTGPENESLPGPVEISEIEFAALGADFMPGPDTLWSTATLPFMSNQLPPELVQNGEPDDIWFRFTLNTPEDENIAYSLLLWRYNLSATVFFNGTEIAGNSERAGRLTTAWNRPLLANILMDQWRPGANEVLIRLHVTRWGGNLAPVVFGPRSILQQIHDARLFRQVDVNRILLSFAVILSAFTLALWLLRRKDSAYLWFSAAGLAWALGTLHMVIYHNPLSYDLWLPLVHSAIDACIFFLYGFIGRLTGTRKARRERLFLLWTVLACTSHFLIPPPLFWYSAYGIHLVGFAVLAAIVVRVALIAWRQRQTEAIVVTLAVISQIALFSYSAFQMFFNNAERWDGALVYAHFGIPLLLLVFSAVLLRRFTNALAFAENLNQKLEHKVEVSRQIIERSFEERRQLERKQAAETERLKIYRDLHDDVGSRLLSIIHADPESRPGQMARSALESLRQAVSKANTPDQTLTEFLADIREETQLRLEGSGHEVEWNQQTDIPERLLVSSIAFNLNRILKELVSNIIRHAQADRVQLDIHYLADTLQVRIRDNGRGFDIRRSKGNGLNNIESRATEIAASVYCKSDQTGTETGIELTLVVDNPHVPA